jgi:hypothetical protein
VTLCGCGLAGRDGTRVVGLQTWNELTDPQIQILHDNGPLVLLPPDDLKFRARTFVHTGQFFDARHCSRSRHTWCHRWIATPRTTTVSA